MKKIKKVLIVILLISIGILAFYFIPVRITPKVPMSQKMIMIRLKVANL